MKKFDLGGLSEVEVRLVEKSLNRRLPEGTFWMKGMLGRWVVVEDSYASEASKAIDDAVKGFEEKNKEAKKEQKSDDEDEEDKEDEDK